MLNVFSGGVFRTVCLYSTLFPHTHFTSLLYTSFVLLIRAFFSYWRSHKWASHTYPMTRRRHAALQIGGLIALAERVQFFYSWCLPSLLIQLLFTSDMNLNLMPHLNVSSKRLIKNVIIITCNKLPNIISWSHKHCTQKNISYGLLSRSFIYFYLGLKKNLPLHTSVSCSSLSSSWAPAYHLIKPRTSR